MFTTRCSPHSFTSRHFHQRSQRSQQRGGMRGHDHEIRHILAGNHVHAVYCRRYPRSFPIRECVLRRTACRSCCTPCLGWCRAPARQLQISALILHASASPSASATPWTCQPFSAASPDRFACCTSSVLAAVDDCNVRLWTIAMHLGSSYFEYAPVWLLNMRMDMMRSHEGCFGADHLLSPFRG